MSFVIELKINERIVSGTLVTGQLIWARTESRIQTGLIPAIEESLKRLLSSNIQPEQITTLVLAVDFLTLYRRKLVSAQRVGYIRYLPKIIETSTPLSGSDLSQLVKTITVTDNASLLQSIEKLKSESITALAINPAISALAAEKEPLNKVFESILGLEVYVLYGLVFNQLGYSTRENLLLINTLLVPGVKEFYAGIHQVFNKLRIQARILTLRHNGMLITEESTIRNPIQTFGSLVVVPILGGCGRIGLYNSLVVTEYKGTLLFSLFENKRLATTIETYEFERVSLKLPTPIVRSISFSRLNEDELRIRIREILSTLNPAEHSLPVVLIKLNPSNVRAVKEICQDLSLKAEALSQHNYCWSYNSSMYFELEHYAVEYDDNKRFFIRSKLWDQICNIAKREGVIIDETWQSLWEERKIRYLPNQAALVRLSVFNKSSHNYLQKETLLKNK